MIAEVAEPADATRAEVIAEIAILLPQRSGQLGRTLWRQSRRSLPRGMASTLASLGGGARTISQLAELEGVAQPTMTRMVVRLENEGLVARERSTADGRVVLVALTDAGARELRGLRQRYREILEERLASLSDAELAQLRDASDALQVLVEALRSAAD